MISVVFVVCLAFLCLSSSRVINRRVELVTELHHDKTCFTQGLLFHHGYLYESCGLYGKSSLRKVDPSSGSVLLEKKIADEIFAEGITIIDNKVWMLTWKNKKLLVFSVNEFDLVATLPIATYNGEGWGLTHGQNQLIASDGSDRIFFYDVPFLKDLKKKVVKTRELVVTDPSSSKRVVHINELEYVNGFIYANVWYKDVILKIDAQSGVIRAKYDLSKLYPKAERENGADCLNGIAYNESGDSFLLTGKLWPLYYTVAFKDLAATEQNNSVEL